MYDIVDLSVCCHRKVRLQQLTVRWLFTVMLSKEDGRRSAI